MDSKDFENKISMAWKAHYGGQHEQAIEEFKQLVSLAPDNVDANWGLGLSYRKAGDKANALQVFEKVRDLLAQQMDAKADDYERLFMLKRMVAQQIEQMNDFIE
jgi:tetratricopeptide (TPR) repeat protein